MRALKRVGVIFDDIPPVETLDESFMAAVNNMIPTTESAPTRVRTLDEVANEVLDVVRSIVNARICIVKDCDNEVTGRAKKCGPCKAAK